MSVTRRLLSASRRAARRSRARTRVLVRGHPQNSREQAQEVKGTQPGCVRGVIQTDRFLRLRVEPERGFHHAATVAGDGIHAGWCLRRHGRCATGREEYGSLIEADVAVALGGGLREFAAYHCLGRRRHASGLPKRRRAADGFGEVGREGESQAFVAADVVLVSAHVLIAGPAEQDRPGDQFEGVAAIAIAETTAAHIGDQERLMLLGIGGILRAAAAPVVGGRDRFGLHQGDSRHRSCSSRWANLQGGYKAQAALDCQPPSGLDR